MYFLKIITMSQTNTLDQILANTKKNTENKRIIFTDIADIRILEAVKILLSEWQRPLLIGKQSDYTLYKSSENNNNSDNNLLEQNSYRENTDYYIVSDDEHVVTHASVLLKNGEIDWLVWGNISSTADILRGLIKNVGTQDGIGRISSYFIIENKKGLFFIGDCAIQAEPTAEQLAEIAFLTAQNTASYWIVPKIAMLSFSTAWSAKHPLVEKVQQATKLAEKLLQESNIEEYIIEWDIQLDAALKSWVWQKKNKDSQLQWQANVLIFPDLNAANIGYKAIDFFGDSTSIWPIIQGLRSSKNHAWDHRPGPHHTSLHHILRFH